MPGRRSAVRSSSTRAGSGRYHTYLCDEIVPFVDERYETNGLSGVSGKSSGGYGAAVTAMLRPDLFSRLREPRRRRPLRGLDPPVLPRRRPRRCANATTARSSASSRSSAPSPAPLAHPDDLHILLQWGFSAAYSADDDGTVRLPYDVATAEVIPELWERWLEWDYPTLVPRHADALREMRAIYVDCGTRDEWYLDLTAEWLRRRLTALPVRDLHVELFDATHLAIEYRYPIGLRYLAERLRSDVEADVQDVAVLHLVGLPLEPLRPALRRLGVRAGVEQVAPGDRLAADEAARDVRVDRRRPPRARSGRAATSTPASPCRPP